MWHESKLCWRKNLLDNMSFGTRGWAILFIVCRVHLFLFALEYYLFLAEHTENVNSVIFIGSLLRLQLETLRCSYSIFLNFLGQGFGMYLNKMILRFFFKFPILKNASLSATFNFRKLLFVSNRKFNTNFCSQKIFQAMEKLKRIIVSPKVAHKNPSSSYSSRLCSCIS